MLPSLPLKADAATPAEAPVNTIQDGSLVIVYENPNSMKAVTVNAKERFDNRFGSFVMKDWVGLPFGSKVVSKGSQQGWVHLLAPTPDLWSNVLRHRTQILYVADISMAVSYLDLAPGSVVLESGTGSGSLTHSLVRAVAPTGHVHTFEFHPERAEEAAKELNAHGMANCVTVRQRNIEALGFPCGAADEAEGMIDLTGAADAVFLDLPAPHKAVPSAAKCLRPDGRFCSFSPCIEQVQRTCEALAIHGFTDVQTLECLLRNHEVRTERMNQVVMPPSLQPALPAQEPSAAAAPVAVGEKRPRSEDETGDAAGGQEAAGLDAGSSEAVEGQGAAGTDVKVEAEAEAGTTTGSAQQQGRESKGRGQGGRARPAYSLAVTSRPGLDARGHTGYLTFARKFVTVTDAGPSSAAAPQPDAPTEAVQ